MQHAYEDYLDVEGEIGAPKMRRYLEAADKWTGEAYVWSAPSLDLLQLLFTLRFARAALDVGMRCSEIPRSNDEKDSSSSDEGERVFYELLHVFIGHWPKAIP